VDDASPLTKEQLRRHWLAGSSGGVKALVPPNSTTCFGRARPHCSLSARLATSPGPAARHAARNSHCLLSSRSQRDRPRHIAARPARLSAIAP
jgi:hypothetical protein